MRMDDDAEADRIIAMTDEELRAHLSAQGLDWDEELAKVKAIFDAVQNALAVPEK